VTTTDQILVTAIRSARVYGREVAAHLLSQASVLMSQSCTVPELWIEYQRRARNGDSLAIADVLPTLGQAKGTAELVEAAASTMPAQDVAGLVERARGEWYVLASQRVQRALSTISAAVEVGEMTVTEAAREAAERIGELRALEGERREIAFAEALQCGLRSAETADQKPEITTGLHSLDLRLRGFRRSALYVFGFRTSDGKTTLAMQQALANAALGRRVAFFSLEMDGQTLGERALIHLSGSPWRAVLGIDREHTLDLYRQTAQRWAREPNQIHLYVDQRMTVDDVALAVQDLRLRHGQVDLVLIDHAQIVEGNEKRRDQRYREVGEIARDLFAMAKRERCAVILYSQLNPTNPALVAHAKRDADPYEPSWADIRESRDVGMHAFAIVLGWSRWAKQESWLKIEKNRQGPRGEKWQVDYQAANFRFEEHEAGPETQVVNWWND